MHRNVLSAASARLPASRLSVGVLRVFGPSPPALGCTRSAGFHTSGAHSFGKRMFRGLFGKRRSDTHDPGAPPRLSLLNQTSIPQDLRLPKPADPLNRISAGVLDLLASGVGGAFAGAATYYASGGALDLATAAGQGVALVLWVLRDGLGDHGNRSLGKRACKLEITARDSTLASPTACLARNAHFLLLPAVGLHPYVTVSFEVLMFWDVAALFLTPDARKVGDYALGTRVVDERPGREARAADMHVVEEVRALRADIERAMPGLLSARERAHPTLGWYENARWQIAGGSAATMGGMQPRATPLGTQGAAGGSHFPDERTDLLRPLRKSKDEQRPSLFDTTPLVSDRAGAGDGSRGPPLGMGGGLFSEVRGMDEGALPSGRVLHVHRPKK